MSNLQEKPVFSWDDADNQQEEGKDFLNDVEAQDVPKACSIDNPECEACQ